jgi:hypothetical protein
MNSRRVVGLLAGIFAARASAVCSTDLVIDDFSKWSNGSNSLGQHASGMNIVLPLRNKRFLIYALDDGTMSLISSSGGSLVFTPNVTSYFYENVACQSATTNGYSALSFSLQGPAEGRVALELQTSVNCTDTAHTSYYYAVNGLTGSSQNIEVPLSSFTGANLNAIQSIVWYGFSSTNASWQLGDVELLCGDNKSSTASGMRIDQ